MLVGTLFAGKFFFLNGTAFKKDFFLQLSLDSKAQFFIFLFLARLQILEIQSWNQTGSKLPPTVTYDTLAKNTEVSPSQETRVIKFEVFKDKPTG